MRKYKVFLKQEGGGEVIVPVRAEDTNLECVEGESATAFWNFITDDVTVAAFPFAVVNYLVSEDAQ